MMMFMKLKTFNLLGLPLALVSHELRERHAMALRGRQRLKQLERVEDVGAHRRRGALQGSVDQLRVVRLSSAKPATVR